MRRRTMRMVWHRFAQQPRIKWQLDSSRLRCAADRNTQAPLRDIASPVLHLDNTFNVLYAGQPTLDSLPMFTMAKIRDGSTYLSNHLTANDYYSEGEKVLGCW